MPNKSKKEEEMNKKEINDKKVKKEESKTTLKKEKAVKVVEEKEDLKETVEVKEEKNKDLNVKETSKKIRREKNSFNLTEVIVVMIVTAMVSLLVGSVATYVIQDQKQCFSSTCSTNKELADFISVYDEIVGDYYKEVDKEALVNAAIKGMLSSLGDTYSDYMDKDMADSFNQSLEGGFNGMGVEITYTDDDTNRILVVTVFEDSPAQKAGLQANDIILKVDNKEVTGLALDEVATSVQKGEDGTTFEVEILRGEEKKVLNVTRAFVELTSVAGEVVEWNGKKVGYIAISVFAKNSLAQFEKSYNNLKKEGIQFLIIDVRGNSGGYLSTAKEISSLFLDKNDIIYQLDTKGVIEKIKSDTEKTIDLPVAVLVNSASASASEVMASSLKENVGALVVGTKTYGKGSVQKVRELSNGSLVKYTIQKWLTSEGNPIDGVGITPDKVVELDTKYYENPIRENDNQLTTALDSLVK